MAAFPYMTPDNNNAAWSALGLARRFTLNGKGVKNETTTHLDGITEDLNRFGEELQYQFQQSHYNAIRVTEALKDESRFSRYLLERVAEVHASLNSVIEVAGRLGLTLKGPSETLPKDLLRSQRRALKREIGAIEEGCRQEAGSMPLETLRNLHIGCNIL